jgi:uncharacterized delta-60 repeat protein
MIRTSRFASRSLARPSLELDRRSRSAAVETLENRTLFAAGDLDPSWGVGGVATIDVPNTRVEQFHAIDVVNGRTVLGGANDWVENSTQPVEVVLAVLDSSGKPVTTFSNDGIETKALSIPGGVIDLVVQPDNKIVVVGGTRDNGVGDVVLARFNPNGLLDTSFGGGDGQVPLAFGNKVALAPGGKIVVAGPTSDRKLGVARFTASGGADGQATATFDFATSSGANDVGGVVVQADGRAVVAGSFYVNDDPIASGDGATDAVVVRFNASLTGTDATFGGGTGVVRFGRDDTTEYGDFAEAVALDAQERIVTASRLASTGPVVNRWLSDGSPDPTFTETDRGADARVEDVSVAPDGKIVVSGLNFFGGDLLMRVNADGGLDTTFGGGDGYIQTWDDGEVAGQISDVQPDGRIISATRGFGDPVRVYRHLAGTTETGTTQTLRATADAYVRDGSHANTNFGNATQLQVKQGATGWNRDAYLRFDLSNVTSATSAQLRVFARLDNTQAASASFNVFNADDTTWAEGQLTWNNRPPAGTAVLDTQAVSGTAGAWYALDLTSFIQAQLAAGRKAVTLVLKGASASPSTIVIDSDEATNKPQLVVTSGTVTPPPTEPATLRAGADSFVRDGSTYANTNFGNVPTFQVKQGATGWNRDAYLRFDLSSVDAVSSAKLRLFGQLDNTQAASAGFTVYSASDTTWSETGLTWNNKPAAGPTVRGAGTVTGMTRQWYEVDLTSFVQAEKAAGRNAVTLVIKATSASPSTILFHSDEENAGTRPELVVA